MVEVQMNPKDIIKVRCLTWNVGNTKPNFDELKHTLNLKELKDVDLIVIGTQENAYKNDKQKLGHTASAVDMSAAKAEVEEEETKAVEDDTPRATTSTLSLRRETILHNEWEVGVSSHMGDDWAIIEKNAFGEMKLFVMANMGKADGINKTVGVQKATSATGIGGVLKNKGGIAISFHIRNTYLTFISSHLNAHMEHEAKRNSDHAEILSETTHIGNPELDVSTDSDHCIWMGDLNYRVDLNRGIKDKKAHKKKEENWDTVKTVSFFLLFFFSFSSEWSGCCLLLLVGILWFYFATTVYTRINLFSFFFFFFIQVQMERIFNFLFLFPSLLHHHLLHHHHHHHRHHHHHHHLLHLLHHHKQMIDGEKWNDILQHDQLRLAQKDGLAWYQFEEGDINFAPTFKVLKNEPGRGHYKKQRVSSYCDRVLWKSQPHLKGKMKCVNYTDCPAVSTSDHKPVIADLEIQVSSPPSVVYSLGAIGRSPAGNQGDEDGVKQKREKVWPVVSFTNLAASNITASDLDLRGSTSDPYITFQSNPRDLLWHHKPENHPQGKETLAPQTKVIGNSLNPKWEDDTVPMLHPRVSTQNELDRSSLLLCLKDSDGLNADDPLGVVRLRFPGYDRADQSRDSTNQVYKYDFDEAIDFNGATQKTGRITGTITVSWTDDMRKQAMSWYESQEVDSCACCGQFCQGGCQCVVQ